MNLLIELLLCIFLNGFFLLFYFLVFWGFFFVCGGNGRLAMDGKGELDFSSDCQMRFGSVSAYYFWRYRLVVAIDIHHWSVWLSVCLSLSLSVCLAGWLVDWSSWATEMLLREEAFNVIQWLQLMELIAFDEKNH